MRTLLAAAIAAVALLGAPLAHGTSATLDDYSGLWSTAGEAGWGVQLTLQGEVLFMVLYVYDDARRPTFYVATGMTLASAAGAGQAEFSGDLFRTFGSPSGTPFDATRFHADPVGRATLRFTAPDAGALSYTVGSVAVSKVLRREVFRAVSLAGVYRGGLFVSTNGCTAGLGQASLAYPGTLSVAQVDDRVTIDTTFEPGFAESGSCRFSGRLVQQGGTAAIAGGTYSCEFSGGVNPETGTFEVSAIQVGESGFSGRYRGNQRSCLHTGRIGGIVRGYATKAPVPEE